MPKLILMKHAVKPFSPRGAGFEAVGCTTNMDGRGEKELVLS